VLGTSGVYPKNISSAVARYPPVDNSAGTSSDIVFGPFARSQATAKPWESFAKAQANGHDKNGGEAVFGPSTALSETTFDGKLLKGTDTVIGYDLKLGPVSIKQMHSVLNYETDGTQAGTKASGKLEFSGLGGDNSKVYTITVPRHCAGVSSARWVAANGLRPPGGPGVTGRPFGSCAAGAAALGPCGSRVSCCGVRSDRGEPVWSARRSW
jgi:hypothetical protein